MSQAHGKDFTLLLGKYAISGNYRGADVTSDIDMADTTTATAEDHAFLAGMGTGMFALDGIFDTAHTQVLDAFRKSTGELIGFFPAGDAVGNVAKSALVLQSSFRHSSQIGDAVVASYQATPSGPVDLGVSLHSSAAARTGAGTGATTAFPGRQWLDLPGTNGHASSNYTTAITTEITLTGRVRADDITPTADASIVGQWGAAGNRNVFLEIDTTGVAHFQYSIDGTASVELSSTVNLSTVVAAGQDFWIRCHHDNDDGANAVTKFYWSTTDTDDEAQVVWTQLGATVSGAQLAARYSSTYAWKTGVTATTGNDFAGRIYQVSVRAGAPTAALVFNPRFDHASEWTVGEDALDTAVDAQGNTWTLQNDVIVEASASSANGGAAYLWVTDFTGTDMTVIVEDSADNAVWATLATFTQVTSGTETSERVVVAGTVDRYLRAAWSTAAGFTTATFTVAFARR